MRDYERVISEIRATAFRRRHKIRCCHGRDSVPKEWTTLFRFLKGAYAAGLTPDFRRDLSGCPCPNSDGYDAVMLRAYQHGLRPEFEYINECCSSHAFVAAYRHGLVPVRRHFAALEPRCLVAVLKAAYEAGYTPTPDDFEDMEWSDAELTRAWRDAVCHGASVPFETVMSLDSGELLREAYAQGALAPDVSHVPFILEHAALAPAYAAGLPFDYDSQRPDARELKAAYDAGLARPCASHFESLGPKDRAASQIVAYEAGLLAKKEHGVACPEIKAIARAQSTTVGAVMCLLGPDIGSKVIERMFVC